MFCGELYVSNWIVCLLSATYAWSHICYCELHCPSYQFSAAGMLKLTSYRFLPLASTRFFSAFEWNCVNFCRYARNAVSFRKLNVLNWILNIGNIQSVCHRLATRRPVCPRVACSNVLRRSALRFFSLIKFYCNIDLQRAVYQREIAGTVLKWKKWARVKIYT